MTATLAIRVPPARGWLVGEARRFFAARAVRRMLNPDRSVLVDVETTDLHGRICEIAVISPDGHVLLDSLVKPGCPIAPAAHAVHGISDSDVADAPGWTEILARVVDVVGDRQFVAYNAPYDQQAFAAMSAPGHPLAARRRWICAMRARAILERSDHWRRLDGGHRALGDTRTMLSLLEGLARRSVR